jgi:hypothetical protein
MKIAHKSLEVNNPPFQLFIPFSFGSSEETLHKSHAPALTVDVLNTRAIFQGGNDGRGPP